MLETESINLPCGYEEDFTSPVDDDLQCLICQLPLREPVLTRCGHRFCRQCLEKHMASQESHKQGLSCPVDREELDRQKDIFPDKATERKILSFAIKCPSDGCDWTGELREKEDHLSSCSFKLVSCTNENCQVTIQRKELEEHATNSCQWRIVVCDHCNESHPKCVIEDHVEKCGKKPVECPNNCGEIIVQAEIVSHTNDNCPLSLVSCPYAQMGCNAKIQRKEVEAHLQSTVQLHLDLTCTTFKETTGKLEEKMNALQLKQEELDKERTTLREQVKELTAKTVALDAKVAAQEKEVSVLKSESSKFVWKINGFNEILERAIDGIEEKIYSKPFFIGKAGYKLSLCIEPDGNQSQRNRYLSVLLRYMKGNYDDILDWPFHQKVTFTLIDQQDNRSWPGRENITQSLISRGFKPTSDAFCSMQGIERFVSHKILKTRRYIVDDTVFLQVDIGPPS